MRNTGRLWWFSVGWLGCMLGVVGAVLLNDAVHPGLAHNVEEVKRINTTACNPGQRGYILGGGPNSPHSGYLIVECRDGRRK